jgi:hypothetical protein
VTFLITAGPTREPLDPVRYISNRSSGKMGYAIAEAALDAEHDRFPASGNFHHFSGIGFLQLTSGTFLHRSHID